MVTTRATYRKVQLLRQLHLLECPRRHERRGFGAVGVERSWPGLRADELRRAQPLHAVRKFHAAVGGVGVADGGGELGNAVQHHDGQRPDGKQPVQRPANVRGKLL